MAHIKQKLSQKQKYNRSAAANTLWRICGEIHDCIAPVDRMDVADVGIVKRATLCQHAKFRRDRSSHCRETAIFPLLKMTAAAILDF